MADVEGMRREVKELRQAIAELDIGLRDYWQRHDALLTEIIETFPHKTVEPEDGSFRPPRIVATGFTWSGAPVRKDIMVELDRLNFQFALVIDERRRLKAIALGLERKIKWTIDEELRRARREQKQRQKQPQKAFSF